MFSYWYVSVCSRLLLVFFVCGRIVVSVIGCFVGGCLVFWFWLFGSVVVLVRIGLGLVGWCGCLGYFLVGVWIRCVGGLLVGNWVFVWVVFC